MAAQFTLKCLGIPRLATAAGQEIPFRVRKHLALLVYLAVEDQTRHRRDQLVELFWPDVESRLGRQSLATALSAIRRRLGGPAALEGIHDHVRLKVGNLTLDLSYLQEGKVVDERCEPVLEIAGFLEGFDVPGLPDFDHWRDRQQARLLPSIQNGLHALVALARRSGDINRLGLLADRLLGINELSEVGILAKMEAAAMSGDRISALQTFDHYEKRLSRELTAKPSVAIEGMAVRLRRRGWERPLDSPEPSVRTEQWQDRDFIGRAKEYRALYELWDGARASRAGHMLITGESGVGKTTLADRFLTAVALEGAQVARAGGHELERGLAFAMIGTLLRALLDRPGAAAASPASLAELARIVPEFATRFPGLPAAPEAAGESARIRLAEALLDFVTALTAEHPLVLLVDNLEQVDDASLAALHFVMRRLTEQPLIILLTSRHQPPQDAPTANRIWETAAQLSVKTLELHPMAPSEAAAVLDALATRATRAPSGIERKALLRAAGGFPLAIELLFGAWQDHGHDLSSLSLDSMTVAVGRGPEAIYRRLAESSLRHLAPTQSMVLHLAAILDRRLGELSMYRLIDLTPTQVATEMLALSARRILCDVGTRMEFVNPAIRGHAYLSIPGVVRAALHSGVADVLLTRHGNGEKVQELEIAWHCVRAGRVDEGRPYILSGAREALDQGAPHEVELAIRTGMDLLDGSDQAHATLLLAEAVGEVGRWVEAMEILTTRPLSASPEVLVGFDALALLCQMRLGASSLSTTEDVLRKAVGIIATAPTVQGRVFAATAGALACTHLRDPGASEQLRTILEPLKTASLPAPAKSHILMSLAALNAHEGRNMHALALVQEASALAASHGLRSALWPRIENGVGAALCAVGRYGEAVQHFENALAGWGALGNEALIRTPANNLALCHWRTGNYEEQLTVLEPVLRLADRDLPTADILFTNYLAGAAAALLGQSERTHRHLEAINSISTSTSIAWLRQRALLSAADLQYLLNQRAKALASARSATSGNFDMPLAAQSVGAFARWKAVLGIEGFGRLAAGQLIEHLARDLATCDLIDQLEVLTGLATLQPLTQVQREELIALWEALPKNVPEQLRLFGLTGKPL